MLHYIENTTQDMADSCSSSRIHKMQERICNIKSSEEVSVRYMQRWEELELEKDEARAEGRAEVRAEGKAEGRAEGKAEGRAEGREEGRVAGKAEERASMALLIKKLLNADRIEDCKKAADDLEFCQKLMDEFGIK